MSSRSAPEWYPARLTSRELAEWWVMKSQSHSTDVEVGGGLSSIMKNHTHEFPEKPY